MGHSQTLDHRQDIPTWARYLVQICHSNDLPGRPDVDREPTQAFVSRVAAERFAREVAKRFPVAPTPSGLTPMWALVIARPVTPTRYPGHCYLAVDPGGVVIKRHAILPGHHGAKCQSCGTSREV